MILGAVPAEPHQLPESSRELFATETDWEEGRQFDLHSRGGTMFSRSKLVVVAVALASAACTRDKMEDMGSSAAAATPAGSSTMDGAEYTLVLKSNWTKANHPLEYPADAHFSGIIGAAHDASYAIF